MNFEKCERTESSFLVTQSVTPGDERPLSRKGNNRVKTLKRKGKTGAQGRDRTTDTRIFSPLLYQLSYLGP
jgi:hypothetical protein